MEWQMKRDGSDLCQTKSTESQDQELGREKKVSKLKHYGFV